MLSYPHKCADNSFAGSRAVDASYGLVFIPILDVWTAGFWRGRLEPTLWRRRFELPTSERSRCGASAL